MMPAQPIGVYTNLASAAPSASAPLPLEHTTLPTGWYKRPHTNTQYASAAKRTFGPRVGRWVQLRPRKEPAPRWGWDNGRHSGAEYAPLCCCSEMCSEQRSSHRLQLLRPCLPAHTPHTTPDKRRGAEAWLTGLQAVAGAAPGFDEQQTRVIMWSFPKGLMEYEATFAAQENCLNVLVSLRVVLDFA